MLLVRRWRELGRLGGGFLRVSVRFLISLSGSILLFDASVVLFFLYFFCFSFVLPLSSSLLFVTASHYSYLNPQKNPSCPSFLLFVVGLSLSFPSLLASDLFFPCFDFILILLYASVTHLLYYPMLVASTSVERKSCCRKEERDLR